MLDLFRNFLASMYDYKMRSSVFSVFLLLSTSFQAWADIGFDLFYKTYAPQIREQLNCIHSHKMTDEKRFLIVQMKDGYIQCMLYDNDTRTYCEVSSGAYNTEQRQFTLAEREALVTEGFDLSVSQGNYPLEIKTDLDVVTERMLKAAYFGFGAPPADIRTFGPYADVCRYIS